MGALMHQIKKCLKMQADWAGMFENFKLYVILNILQTLTFG